jgi:hypothetical protein
VISAFELLGFWSILFIDEGRVVAFWKREVAEILVLDAYENLRFGVGCMSR